MCLLASSDIIGHFPEPSGIITISTHHIVSFGIIYYYPASSGTLRNDQVSSRMICYVFFAL